MNEKKKLYAIFKYYFAVTHMHQRIHNNIHIQCVHVSMFNAVYVLRMTKFVRKCNFPNLLLLLPFLCSIRIAIILLIVSHVQTTTSSALYGTRTAAAAIAKPANQLARDVPGNCSLYRTPGRLWSRLAMGIIE